MESTTVAAPFVEKLLDGARARGHNVDQVLRENGISPNVLRVPGSRVTFEQLARLCLSLTKLLDDEYLGLTDRPQRRHSYRLMCYSAVVAETIGEAMRIVADFSNIMESPLIHEVHAGETALRYELRRRPRCTILNSYAVEYCMLSIHRTLNWLADGQLPLRDVALDYPAPPYEEEYRYMFFGAPVEFDQPVSALIFAPDVVSIGNVRDLAEVKAFVRQAPLTLLSQTTDPGDLSARLRRWIETELQRRRAAPGIGAAAAQMGLHSQTMRRQLAKQGTTYRRVKAEVRRDLAINLINDATMTVEAISESLGFSEPSAFIRAFRGWTGLTPLAYRKLST